MNLSKLKESILFYQPNTRDLACFLLTLGTAARIRNIKTKKKHFLQIIDALQPEVIWF